jgi:hypothetical protein
MGWFRKNRGWGAWCAVFALACQFALAFTHVHAWGFGPRAVAALTARLAAQLPPADRSPDRLPSMPAPSFPKKGGDLCPICTLIGLAGSLLPVLPPSLSLPFVVADSVLSIAAETERILSSPSLFQAPRASDRLTSAVWGRPCSAERSPFRATNAIQVTRFGHAAAMRLGFGGNTCLHSLAKYFCSVVRPSQCGGP